MARNVLGGELEDCSRSPLTGFYRTGCCDTGGDDAGVHVVCARMTEAFLTFSVQRGNDLVTAVPQAGFPGLRPGDSWCLCADRWQEALEAGVAPPVHLEATHAQALEWVTLDELRRHAVDDAVGGVGGPGGPAAAVPEVDVHEEEPGDEGRGAGDPAP